MEKTRFTAKALDYVLLYSFLYLLNFSSLVNIALLFLLPLLFIPVEAMLYSTIKTTPGKWLFGISLSKRLSLQAALKASMKKGILLLPLFFPPLNVFFLMFYRRESSEHKENRWNNFEGATIVKERRNKVTKYLLLSLIAAGLIVNFTPSRISSGIISISNQELHLDSWVEVKNDKLNFTVYFPKEPSVEQKAVDVKDHNTTLDVTEYSHKDKIAYSLVSSKIPSSWTYLGSNYLFKSLAKSIEEHQGKISSKDICKHKNYPAMNYVVDNHEGGQTKGTLILVKKTIYKLEVTAEDQLTDADQAIAADFISTFNVI